MYSFNNLTHRLLASLFCLGLFGTSLSAFAGHRILSADYKSLQVVLNGDPLALPIMTLGSDDVLDIGFDQLSHTYHRLIYRLEPCNPDWTACDGLFESDWLEGFNNMPVEDYENSINTTVLYTHYRMTIPNEHSRLKMSGNYRLHIVDEETDEEVMVLEFRVAEPLMSVSMAVTTNTDIDINLSHQQVEMQVGYGPLRVTNVGEQLQTFVMQNGREDNMKENVRPDLNMGTGLKWQHNRALIFEAGNEYRKFEVLDPSHATMGLERVVWDEAQRRYHAYPFVAEPRRNYIYDEDANGAFIIRNSDNTEIDITSDYVLVHYTLKALRRYDHAIVSIDGRWCTEPKETYRMTYDEQSQTYNATVLQKLGYYNYRFMMSDLDGTTHQMPEEGSFYQTENQYTAFVYYKGTGERSWRLVGLCDKKFK